LKFLIPKDLNLEQLILAKEQHLVFRRITVNGKRKFEKTLTKSKSLLKHIPYCYYIIDLIIKRQREVKNNNFGYVNLRSELLDKVIPHTTRIMILSLLEELNIIQINHSYQINEYSKSYKLNPMYDISTLFTVDFDIDIKKGYYIGDNISIKKGYYIDDDNKDKEVRKSLCSILFEKSGKIEKKTLKQRDNKTNDLLSLTEYSYQQKNIFNLNLDYESIEKDNKKSELLPLLEKVSNGNLSINLNNSVNRVFSPITNLKKEYRKYIVDTSGNSLTEIDFKSSHIFHLIKIITDSTPSIELLDEVNRLKEIALSDIYEYVAMQGKKIGYILNRQEAKQLFIESFLYGMFPKRKRSIWVNSLFPAVSEFLNTKNRKQRSIEIQKSESYLLNNRIFKRIAIELPDSINYGIFDSILVERKYIDEVYQIMKEESAGYFGYQVPITTKGTNIQTDKQIDIKIDENMNEQTKSKKQQVIELLQMQEYKNILQMVDDTNRKALELVISNRTATKEVKQKMMYSIVLYGYRYAKISGAFIIDSQVTYNLIDADFEYQVTKHPGLVPVLGV